ncbi:MAG: hypothetical protein IJF52_01775 [Clostridia bacterium]|nr:hypothetical protein [Clostridia bacterium]
MPGGACGYWGACGAALANEEWKLSNLMTAASLSAIGEVGGPRRCKRNSYIAITEAVKFAKEHLSVEMELTQQSKTFDKIPNPDIVVSMGCNVACPVIGRDFDDIWGLSDPTGKADEDFLKVIKQIEENIMNIKY